MNKVYKIDKGMIKGILDLCNSKRLFEVNENVMMELGYIGIEKEDNIFALKSDIRDFLLCKIAKFGILYSEKYFIDNDEIKMFNFLKSEYGFDIDCIAENKFINVEVLGLAFSILHEVFHMVQYIEMMNDDRDIGELQNTTEHLYEEVMRLEEIGIDATEKYRRIPQERFADTNAIIFIYKHLEELIDIVLNNTTCEEMVEGI